MQPSSLPVDRRARRAKTDIIDVEMLLRTLMAWLRGEPRVCSMVPIPSEGDEEARRAHREREDLTRERRSIVNKIDGILATLGVKGYKALRRDRPEQLNWAHQPDGDPIPPKAKARIERLLDELDLVMKLIEQVESERDAVLKNAAPADEAEGMIRSLAELRSIGPDFATLLVREAFVRQFRNRRALGGYVGLAGRRSQAAAANANKGSGKTATDGFARRWSNLPGCGCAGSRTAPCPCGPRACWRNGRGYQEDHDRRPGPQAARRLVALREGWRHSRRSKDETGVRPAFLSHAKQGRWSAVAAKNRGPVRPPMCNWTRHKELLTRMQGSWFGSLIPPDTRLAGSVTLSVRPELAETNTWRLTCGPSYEVFGRRHTRGGPLTPAAGSPPPPPCADTMRAIGGQGRYPWSVEDLRETSHVSFTGSAQTAIDYNTTIIGALELSSKKWVLAVQLPGVDRHSRYVLDACGDAVVSFRASEGQVRSGRSGDHSGDPDP